MNRRQGFIPVVIVGVSACTAAAAPIAIDNFSDVQSVDVPAGPIGTTGSDGIAAAGAIKGARYIAVTRNTVSGFDTTPVRVNQAPNLGMFTLASDPSASYDATVIWDGNTNGVVDPDASTVDLSSSGANSIIQFQYSTDVSGASLDLTMYDGDSSDTYSMPLANTNGVLVNFFIPFADFTGLDFAAITAAKLDIFGATNLDLRLDLVETDIPGPGSIALTAIAGLYGVRRRRG